MKRTEQPDNYECRSATGTVEFRENENGGATISGFAALFDVLSENLGGFREIIMPGAFDDTDLTDVRGLFNHDTNFVLGRTTSKTLSLTIKKRGFKYSIDLPDTRTITDLVLSPIKRKDVTQSSFGFIVGRGNDEWDENDDGVLIRTIRKFKRVFDVSPVVFPAYPDTTVGARSMQKFKDDRAANVEVLKQHATRGALAEAMQRRAQFPGLQL